MRSGILLLEFLSFVGTTGPSPIPDIGLGDLYITSGHNLVINRDIPYPASHGHVRDWDVGHAHA
jgi:hypothetical protein